MKLTKFEVEEIWSWKIRSWKILSWRNLKLKKFEIEEIWSWGWQQSYLWKEKSNSGKKVCLDGVNVKTEGNMGKENGN